MLQRHANGTGSALGAEDDLPSSLLIVSSFGCVCVLLLVGHLVRTQVRVLRRLFLPASLLGGLVGLAIVQLLSLDDGLKNVVETEWIAGWEELPSFLISIVFTCLFLGERIPSVGTVWREAGPQLMYGQILAWGQYAFPATVAGVILMPAFNVDKLIAPVVALGFEGGHGTAAGVKQSFVTLGYAEGANLTLCAATIGLLSGMLFGTVAINWAVRRRLVTKVVPTDGMFNGMFAEADRPIAGHQTTSPESVDSAAFHLTIVGLGLLIGYAIKRILLVVEEQDAWLKKVDFFSSFPLFPFCLFGGLLIQLVIDRFPRMPVDRLSFERISGIALEFTVVTAVVTMEFEGLEESLAAFVILILCAWLWHAFCFFFLAPRLLPDFWVERAVAELGQSMGVTATGLLLLRMVDPENQTPALAAFSYKQLLHEPVVGGGLWTATVLSFISAAGLWPAVAVSWSAVVFWLCVYFFYFRHQYKRPGYRQMPSSSKEDAVPLVADTAASYGSVRNGAFHEGTAAVESSA
eukprot:m.119339 g.119339  ORF g.119339 m.119339 type:complete len:520 (-) comp16464_c0_seq10:40-1599(-)